MEQFIIEDDEVESEEEELNEEDKSESEEAEDSDDDQAENDDNVLEFLKGYNQKVNDLKSQKMSKCVVAEEKIFASEVETATYKFITKEVDSTYESRFLTYPTPGHFPECIMTQLKCQSQMEHEAGRFYLRGSPAVDCLKLYTAESPFYSRLNSSLAEKEFDLYSEFLSTLLYYEKHLSPVIPGYTVYRGMTITADCLKGSYKEGQKYFWTAFNSSTLSESIAQNFMLMGNPNGIPVLFQIQLNPKNTHNKYYLKDYSVYSNEEEVLLLPYFSFKVREKKIFIDPHTHTRKALVHLKEVKTNYYGNGMQTELTTQGKVYFVWTDQNINNPENSQYQRVLKDLLGDRVSCSDNMPRTRQCLNDNVNNTYFVISNGMGKEEFVKEIGFYGNVAGIVVFTSSYRLKECKMWMKDAKVKGVFDNFTDVVDYLVEWCQQTGRIRKGVPEMLTEEERRLQEEKERRIKEEKERRLREEKERRLREEKERRLREEKERRLREEKERRLREEKERRLREEKEQRLREEKEQRLREEKERERRLREEREWAEQERIRQLNEDMARDREIEAQKIIKLPKDGKKKSGKDSGCCFVF